MKRATTVSRSVEIGLRFIGMWPDSAYPNLYWSMYMTMIVISQYYQYSYIVVHFELNNLSRLTDCLSLAITNTVAFLKLFSLWWNRRIFYNILAAMDRDWNDSVINDSYSTMIIAAIQSRRCSFVIIGLYMLTGFFLSIGTYMYHTMNADSEVPREFPVKMEFPSVALESPFFECILAGQIFYIMSLASVVGMTNALLPTLILHVSGQVDIMRQAIKKIHSNHDEFDTPLIINNFIHRHRKIITLSDDIENLFSFIALLQLLWNTLIICFAGFMIILALSSNKNAMILIKATFLYIAKTLEVFVFCYAGEYLSFKSKSISDAIYESFWYKMVPSNCRILLFIMMRSQKRLTLTAGKIFDLTLEGFMSVMKASASYMSVLHAMY